MIDKHFPDAAPPIIDNQESVERFDIAIKAPGFPLSVPVVDRLGRLGVRLLSDLDIGYLHRTGKIVGITGTNGKTTTTRFLERILAGSPLAYTISGNLERPFCTAVPSGDVATIHIVELSYAFLEKTSIFRADVAAITNVEMDHRDRHTFDKYRRIKLSILSGGEGQERIVGDQVVGQLRGAVGSGRCLPDIASEYVRIWYGRNADELCAFVAANPELSADVKDYLLTNRNSLLIAAAIASKLGVDTEAILRGIERMEIVPHRLERIGWINQRYFFNDAKATNIAAAERSFEIIKRLGGARKIVIVGGRTKNSDVGELLGRHPDLNFIVFGSNADEILGSPPGVVPLKVVDSLDAAFKTAVDLSAEGDLIALCPCCSADPKSFVSTEAMGVMFKELICRYEGRQADNRA